MSLTKKSQKSKNDYKKGILQKNSPNGEREVVGEKNFENLKKGYKKFLTKLNGYGRMGI
jgi:hypothetical protein